MNHKAGNPKYRIHLFKISAVASISSSSAFYCSTLPTTSGPLTLFFKMISIAVAFISPKSITFTICFPITSCKVAKHTVAWTVVLLVPSYSYIFLVYTLSWFFQVNLPIPTCNFFSDVLLPCLFLSIVIVIAKDSLRLHQTCDPFLNFLHMIFILHLHFSSVSLSMRSRCSLSS
jgi:hypothetical protein